MIEVRRIRATQTELEYLIANFMTSVYRAGKTQKKAFSLTDMSYTSIKPLKITIKGVFGCGQKMSATLPADLIVAAFVAYCSDASIPMCRNAIKSVSKTADGVVFDIIIKGFDINRAPADAVLTENTFIPTNWQRITGPYQLN